MEAGLVPTNITKLIKWLLQTAEDNDWTVVFEYSIDEDISFFTNNSVVVTLPKSSRYNYDSDTCKLIAIKNFIPDDNFIDEIISRTHVLTLHNDKEMILLAADDYHEDCFTCSKDFYDKYYDVLCNRKLVLCI